MINIRILKLFIMLEDQKIKMFLQMFTLQIGLNKFLWLKKLKILCCRHLLSLILMAKRLLEHFRKRNCKKQIKQNLEMKKWSREKVINYILNEKCIIINSWIDKKHMIKISEYFPKPNSVGIRVKVVICLFMQQKQIYKMRQELMHLLLLNRLI